MDFSTGGWLIMSQPNGLLILGDHLFLNYKKKLGRGGWLIPRGLLILTWHYSLKTASPNISNMSKWIQMQSAMTWDKSHEMFHSNPNFLGDSQTAKQRVNRVIPHICWGWCQNIPGPGDRDTSSPRGEEWPWDQLEARNGQNICTAKLDLHTGFHWTHLSILWAHRGPLCLKF